MSSWLFFNGETNSNRSFVWLSCTGISRDSMHKRRATGGKKKAWRKKRKYELGRQPAMTKLSSNKTVRRVRVRGGNVKWRALRLDTGNYSWGSEAVTRKARILDVVYNASNNELVRTQTLVKSAIVQVDATPFKQWYLQHYGVDIGRKKKSAVAKKEGEEAEAAAATTEETKSNHVQRKIEKRQKERTLDAHRGAVWQWPSACLHLIPPWSMRSCRWVYTRRKRARVLHEETPEEEGQECCLDELVLETVFYFQLVLNSYCVIVSERF
ncbi:40S ribosomal protein S8 [Rhynchospora pubera]|uniref:40S ribosomal protein S8 n=1 Tax=Rhynchospora pubera TaxID=906938 RepID=A0AAV8CKJ5_9POAL|nr:40S ribosomal protein S8 [Rhynchospora pubera]